MGNRMKRERNKEGCGDKLRGEHVRKKEREVDDARAEAQAIIAMARVEINCKVREKHKNWEERRKRIYESLKWVEEREEKCVTVSGKGSPHRRLSR